MQRPSPRFRSEEYFVFEISVGLSTSCSNFLRKLFQFSQKVAQKLLQNPKVAFNFLV